MIANINTDCECLPLARADIDRRLGQCGLSKQVDDLLKGRENIFAQTPVFVSHDDHAAMLSIIDAIEALTHLQPYQHSVLARAGITLPVQKTHGLILGYDFHLSDEGPRLIEVNTNAGGAFIVSKLLRAVGSDFTCCYESNIYGAKSDQQSIDAFLVSMFGHEFKLGGGTALKTLAIIDEDPAEQYLYPDMLIAKSLLEKNGIDVLIADPGVVIAQQGGLYIGEQKIDMIYNRLTDFMLADLRHQHLKAAYESRQVVVSPAPFHHALFADKRNLILFGNDQKLSDFGLNEPHRSALATVPKTVALEPENADELWTQRKVLFFKPRDGFGSRAAYRGRKITTKVWGQISAGSHVAQEFVPPSLRVVTLADGAVKLKFDLRIYTFGGQPFAMAARVYQGQTTNFRTRGGGFAPVILINN